MTRGKCWHQRGSFELSSSRMASASPTLSDTGNPHPTKRYARVCMGSRALRCLPISLRPRRSASLTDSLRPTRRLRHNCSRSYIIVERQDGVLIIKTYRNADVLMSTAHICGPGIAWKVGADSRRCPRARTCLRYFLGTDAAVSCDRALKE